MVICSSSLLIKRGGPEAVFKSKISFCDDYTRAAADELVFPWTSHMDFGAHAGDGFSVTI